VRIVALLTILLWPACLWAEYAATEILVIPWGDGPDELRIEEPYTDGIEITPDSAADALFPSGGPHWGFVDVEENVYFISKDLHYLKGFHNNGKAFVDAAVDTSDYEASVIKYCPTRMFVDSAGFIYVFFIHGYPSIFNSNGDFVSILDPPGDEPYPHDIVSLDFYNFDEELNIHSYKGDFIFQNGNFTKGGYRDWKASDGYYYWGNRYDTSTFRFIKFKTYAYIDTYYVKVDRKIGVGALMGIDLNDNYYMRYSESKDDFPLDILVLDRNFKEKDHFRLLPERDNMYLWNVHNATFLRGDGNVYQFLCEDDGMHVIRWGKE